MLTLNIHKPYQIKYRVDTSRCIKYGVQDAYVLGWNYNYTDEGEPEMNIVFSIPLPIGKWKIVESEEFHTIILERDE